MAYTCVRVTFEIGHEASIRAKKTSEGFTHDWELYVRGSDNTEIHHFVEKVIFHLHESFRNPKRVIKDPPYVVRESGYAGFALPIDIYLKNKHEPSKIRFNYQLSLQECGQPISLVKREKYVFKNPSEDFRRKLIRGGGVGVGADSASSSHTNHMAALNTDHSADEHRNLVNNKNKGSPQDGSVAKKLKKDLVDHGLQISQSSCRTEVRWLSFPGLMDYVFDEWDNLVSYFAKKLTTSDFDDVRKIYVALLDPYKKLYAGFLSYVLPKFKALNDCFRNKDVIINTLHDRMAAIFKEFLLCFIEHGHVYHTRACMIDPNDVSHFAKQIYLGMKVVEQSEKLPKREMKNSTKLIEFHENCRRFLITAVMKIKECYDFGSEILPMLACFTPENSLSGVFRDKYPSIASLILALKRLVSEDDQEIDDDWRTLPFAEISEETKNVKDVTEYWVRIQMDQQLTNNESFLKALPQFVLNICALPLSNVDCERIMNKVKGIKAQSFHQISSAELNTRVQWQECVAECFSSNFMDPFIVSHSVVELIGDSERVDKEGRGSDEDNVTTE